MIKPTEREILKNPIEEEMDFLKGILKPIGDYYHNFIRAYGRVDRGLKEASNLILYIKEEWPIFIKKRSKVSLFFPYVLQEEVEIISKLNQQIEEATQLINKATESKRALYPEEISTLAYYFPTLRIYVDYVAGRDYLTYEMLERRRLGDILERFRPTIDAFGRKVIRNNNDFLLTFDMGGIEEYSFLTLFTIDAYDNSLLRKLTEAKGEEEREEILKEYSPLVGLDQILFSKRKEIEEYNRKSLRERKERKNLCLPRGGLGQRIKIIDGGGKFFSYVQRIYGKNREDLWYV
jgi:hypothetical protein